jgi:Ca-activated chloride channel family protein
MRSRTRSVLSLPFWATLIAAGLPSTGPAVDPVTVIGRVVHAVTGEPIGAAQVFVRDTFLGTLTRTDGTFRLVVERAQLPSAEVQLVVQRIGFRTAVAQLSATDLTTGAVSVEFALVEQALALDEVVVTGGRGDPRGSADRSVEAPVPTTFVSGTPARVVPMPAPPAPPGPDHDVLARRAAAHTSGGRPGIGREQYSRIVENEYRSARDNPLSTFSIDVDRASYSNIRRFLLGEHRLPPADAVQIEEMVNYFSYDYELPEGRHPVAVTTEVGPAPWAPEHRLLRIGLATRPIVGEDMPRANLVFLIDVSGSMASGNKLPLVKRALRLVVDQLRPQDRVAIVVYAGAAGLVLDSTPGSRRERILEAIERLEAGGSTAGGAGLRLAYRVARENFVGRANNRVILATDGDFNVGESSDAAMIRLIEERRGQGTFLTVLGFGTGNLQSEKMQSLAQHGNGNYAYIDSMEEARKVFVAEMGGTLVTVAQDVKIQVEFNPAQVRGYRLVGYENRLLANEDFNDDRKDAGEMGAGHRVTALYEVVPIDVEPDVDIRGVDPLRYRDDGPRTDGALRDEIAFVRVRYKEPRGSRSSLLEHPVLAGGDDALSGDLSFAAAVAGFGMLLRESEHRGEISARQVLALAKDGIGQDPDGYRRGFLELVRAYREIVGDGRDQVRRR